MKSIRWGGLITFIAMGLLCTVALLFAGTIFKPLMESGFTKMNGAKVDIGNLGISYSPFTIELNNIQIADPMLAMVNTAQIKKIKFAMPLDQLLLGKVLIDEATVNGIQIDTPRKASGLIEQSEMEDVSKDESDNQDIISMPDLGLPDAKTILASEPLLSDKLIDELNQDFSDTEVQWGKTSDSLTDEGEYNEYETRYNNIEQAAKGSSSQKVTAIKDAKKLSSDLKNEAQRIKQAKQQFSTDLKRINSEIKAVKNSPKKDIERIKSKYKLGNLNTQNISQMLFGDQVSGYISLAKQWYGRIEPYMADDEGEIDTADIERSKGVDVVFWESKPMPDLFVGVALITADLPRGQFEGKLTAISSDQSINKQSMRLKLKGISLVNKESEEINAEFNYIDKKKGFTQFNYSVAKANIEDFVLSKSSQLPLTMKQALMNFHLYAKLQNGTLNGLAKSDFKKVKFDSGKTSSTLASSFANIKRFNIEGRFSGSIDNLSVNIDSNLDNQLGQQLKNKLNAKNKKFEADLKSAIDQKIKGPMDKVAAKKEKLNTIQNQVDTKEKYLKQRLASLKKTINTKNEQKKEAATDKLKDKLKGKFGF